MKNNSMKILMLLFLTVLLQCASDSTSNSFYAAEINMRCDEYYAIGQIEYDHYSFCSTVPVDIEYSYKKGNWKYWNKSGKLIAVGKFRLEKQIIEDQGGCSYEMISGKIDQSNWKFWDSDDNEITSLSTQRGINYIFIFFGCSSYEMYSQVFLLGSVECVNKYGINYLDSFSALAL